MVFRDSICIEAEIVRGPTFVGFSVIHQVLIIE